MHPQLYLRTFWKQQLKPQVFVAMSFDPVYKSRFTDIIAPAIQSIAVDNVPLTAHRVDISKTGDSILTEIMDGIAHSQMVLAEVSTLGKDSKTGRPYRNANVMYEVGLALACRHPSEVLLIRDDRDPFLFDVSTVPHMNIDFTNVENAKRELHEEVKNRLNERQHLDGVRAELAYASLTWDETMVLETPIHGVPGQVFGRANTGSIDFVWANATPRLLDKQLIRCVGQFQNGSPAYTLTHLGNVVLQRLKQEQKIAGKPIDGGMEPPGNPDPENP